MQFLTISRAWNLSLISAWQRNFGNFRECSGSGSAARSTSTTTQPPCERCGSVISPGAPEFAIYGVGQNWPRPRLTYSSVLTRSSELAAVLHLFISLSDRTEIWLAIPRIYQGIASKSSARSDKSKCRYHSFENLREFVSTAPDLGLKKVLTSIPGQSESDYVFASDC